MAGVKTLHPDYSKFSPKWQRTRDCIEGQDAIHRAGESYLPKFTNETAAEYSSRVKRSDFWNGTWRTIDALSGMAFRKPPTVDVPAAIESHLEDVTMAGKSIEAFAKETLEEVLSPGRFGILVDHPPSEIGEDGKVVPITKAVAEQRGIRPTLQLYTAESIRNWKFARVKNAWVLVMVVLGEKVALAKDEFESSEEDRYRVLDLDEAGQYRQRLFKVEDGKDILVEGPIYPQMNGAPLDFVPFYIVGANGRGDQIDEPPLIDLVDKNLAHYQVNSDYRHGAHMTALPTPFFSGIQLEAGEKIYIGGTSAIVSPHPDATATFLEYEGQGLTAIEKMLDRIERQMALLGARMIADETAQAETLGATQIKRAGENSVLAKIVQAVSEALELALGVFAEWAGHPAKITYQINRDFLPAMMDAQTLNALFAGVMSGNISKRELFELLQRGDVIDGQKGYEEHQREIDEEAPTLARPDAKAPAEDDEDEAA